jgi:hypothetical protein
MANLLAACGGRLVDDSGAQLRLSHTLSYLTSLPRRYEERR